MVDRENTKIVCVCVCVFVCVCTHVCVRICVSVCLCVCVSNSLTTCKKRQKAEHHIITEWWIYPLGEREKNNTPPLLAVLLALSRWQITLSPKLGAAVSSLSQPASLRVSEWATSGTYAPVIQNFSSHWMLSDNKGQPLPSNSLWQYTYRLTITLVLKNVLHIWHSMLFQYSVTKLIY